MDCKDVEGHWREKIERAKAQLKVHLATAEKDSKKCFYKYISSEAELRTISIF